MAESQILEFAGNPTALVQTYAQYFADLQRIVGNQPGLARPEFVNKVLNQTSKMSVALAGFIVDQSGNSVLDSHSVATIQSNLLLAIQNVITSLGSSSWDFIGMVIPCPVETAPEGFLECNGAAISKTTYADLYAFMKSGGDTAIYGESGTNFYLPDYRGRFLRGWDHGIARDPDRATRTNRGDTQGGDHVGTTQDDEYKAHNHNVYLTANSADDGSYPYQAGVDQAGNMSYVSYTARTTQGGNETRPKNINAMWIIKY